MSDEQTPTSDAGQGAGHTDPPVTPPAPEPTIAELRKRAGELDVDGRSSMGRDELVTAIAAAEAQAELDAAPVRTAFADAMGALFNTHDTDRPATDEEVGRPPLVEVAQQRAAARAARSRNR